MFDPDLPSSFRAQPSARSYTPAVAELSGRILRRRRNCAWLGWLFIRKSRPSSFADAREEMKGNFAEE